MRFLGSIALALISSAAFALSPDFAEQLATMQCTAQLKTQVSPHLQRQTWYPQPVSIPGLPLMYGIAFRDTKNAKAYEIWAENARSIFVTSDLKSGKEIKYVWTVSRACELKKITQAIRLPQIPATDGFNDNSLRDLMAAHSWGIIYVWTPYMPYSVDGLKEIKAAVQAKGGFLTVVLDGKASLEQAKIWVDKGLVQASEMTPVGSYELYARDIGLHYPIAFIYKDKFLSNRTYVGHKTNPEYQKWIDSELAELQKDLLP